MASMVLLCVFVTVSFATALNASPNNNAGPLAENMHSMNYSFTFTQPSLHEQHLIGQAFYSLDMNGGLDLGTAAGNPALPVKFVQLLVPAMKTVTGIQVQGEPVELHTNSINLKETPIIPYQNPIPIGSPPPTEIALNDQVYQSAASYPSAISDNTYQIGYCHGYAILSFAITPVQYVPAAGTLSYYPIVTVTITLQDDGQYNQFYDGSTADEAYVKTLVSNPEITATYQANPPAPLDYPGGLCDPSQHFDYVVVTTTQNSLNSWQTGGTLIYNWDSLFAKHAQEGLQSTVVTIQDINGCSDYVNSDPLFNDAQAHIREFSKDAYEDWGTRYILFAGDSDKVPVRDMDYSYESSVDTDIYYSNLDKTFNADHDSKWGEEGDLGFDLYSELYVGRLPCDVPQDVSNWLTKVFFYMESNALDYLKNAGFYGGELGWNAGGDDFIDFSAIKGVTNWLGPSPGAHGVYPSWLGFLYGFDTWNEKHPGLPYNMSNKWTAESSPNQGWRGGSESVAIAGLRDAINNDHITLLSAVAHADEHMSCDVQDTAWATQYHNTKPFFMFDYGCHCGDFDAADDGVVDVMLYNSDTKLAFACVYNSGYGWGSFDDTNSSSALQMKLFWDYIFDTTNNSGSSQNWQMGKAQAWSKDKMAPTINWTYSSAPGSWRGIIESCLLFGDPALKLKTPRTNDAPSTPSTPAGPTSGAVGIEYSYATSSTDPDNDSILYKFDWGDGTDSGWVGPFDSGTNGNATHLWTNGGPYQIHVQAMDVIGAVTNWSSPLSVYMGQPVIQIGKIKGGLGVKIDLVNNGDGNGTFVRWRVTIVGGIGGTITLQKAGTILTFGIGETQTIKPFGVFFGFGKLNITVEANPFYGDPTKQTVQGFIFGPFVIIKK